MSQSGRPLIKQYPARRDDAWQARRHAWITGALLLGLAVFAGGCVNPADTTRATSALTEPTSTTATTVEIGPTITPSPTSSPSPSPSPSTTPTQPPLPSSVYVPRQGLPEGQIFPAGYYALLKGEGATYQIYDCRGQLDYLLTLTDTDGSIFMPNGLYSEDQLWRLGYMDPSRVQGAQLPTEDGRISRVRSYANGFYQIRGGSDRASVDLYSRDGRKLITLTQQAGDWYQTVVAAYDRETLVCFYAGQKTILHMITANGQIRQTITCTDSQGYWNGLLAGKYCLINDNLCTLDGDIIKDGVTMQDNPEAWLCGNEGNPNIRLGDFFFWRGVLYDARTMNPMAAGTTLDDGSLIEGVTYDVKGIPCVAYYYDDAGDLVAVGRSGDRLAIRTRDASYSFLAPGYNYLSMNQSTLALANKGRDIQIYALATGRLLATISAPGYDYLSMNQSMLVLANKGRDITIYALATGRLLATISQADLAETGDEYLIFRQKNGFFILDQEGRVRLASEKAEVRAAAADCLLLDRGPYVGIADLNGDWLVKTLAWELTRDAPNLFG
jgi:hypothetical protein